MVKSPFRVDFLWGDHSHSGIDRSQRGDCDQLCPHLRNRSLFCNKPHASQQEAEASVPRAEPQAEKRASVVDDGVERPS